MAEQSREGGKATPAPVGGDGPEILPFTGDAEDAL